jgi:enoyl-CoA hydratase/carnithine racemase
MVKAASNKAEPEVVLERKGSVAIIKLNRPNIRNPLTHTLSEAFLKVLSEAEEDLDVRAIVLTGAGPVFCSGAEVGKLVHPDGVDMEWQFQAVRSHCKMVQRIRESDLPIIAAVNGAAVGGGAALAICCDLAIAATNTKYFFAFGRIGLGAWDMACTYTLPKLVGTMKAYHWMLTCATVEAQEGKDAGLFVDVVEPDQLIERAVELGEKIAEGAPRRATAGTKLSLTRTADMDLQSCLSYEAYTQCYLFQRQEHKELLGKLLTSLNKR